MSKHSALNTFGRSGNPAFTKNFGGSTYDIPLEERMTLDGAVNKTGILLSLCFAGAFIGWNIPALLIPSWIIGMILGLLTIFDFDGSDIGISITSILNKAVLLSPGIFPIHSSISSSSLTPAVPEL